MGLLNWLSQSKIVEIALTALVYCIYAAVLALSIVPSVWLVIEVVPEAVEQAAAIQHAGASSLTTGVFIAVIKVAVTLAGALYLYVFFGSIFQALLIRLLSLGVKPGRYPAVSLTTVRWLIYSGIYSITTRTILPLIPVTFVMNMYFRIIGCRIGRNVKLNTFQLNDAYLLTIGDNVIIGGQTDISCHLFESNHLILKPIVIGDDTLIGAHSYISPGVTIGRRCIVGLYSYIRSDKVIPDGSVITSLAGIDTSTARDLERGGRARRERPRGDVR